MTKKTGFTLIELLITLAILAILASATMPLLKMSVQRKKESELRENLRQIRNAIDAYKLAYDENRLGGNLGLKKLDSTGYPPNLDVLVEGVESNASAGKKKLKFLRRIPTDPMSTQNDYDESPQWGMRSYNSDPNNPVAGEDVYDVYSLSPLIGSNGIPYAKW